MTVKNTSGKKVFVEAGEPISLMGAAISNMRREGDALLVGPDEKWGNPLFADCALEEKDFHIHARMTLDTLAGTGASLLIGGFYHYPCSRPQGNGTFRVSLDSGMERYDPYNLETEGCIAYGMTGRRAPWSCAEREIAGRTSDYIEPGQPFKIDFTQRGRDLTFHINGKEVFSTSLQQKGRLSGSSDGGWPVCFGILPDQAVVKVHDFYAEGSFTHTDLDHEDVWSMGHDGYFTYRIPSLCVTNAGSLLAFVEARRSDFGRAWGWSKEWNADEVHCVMKRSTDGGRTWSAQKQVLARGSLFETRDPSPLVDRETGRVFLMLRGPYMMSSEDEGESWSEPRSLRALIPEDLGVLSAGPANSAIQLCRGEHAGRLVFAVAGDMELGVVFSDDHGENWRLGGMIRGYAGVEPQLTELTDGRILLNSRNHSENAGRLISVSSDGGATFENHYDDRLPSRRCQASLIRFDSPEDSEGGAGSPVLFCGPGEGRNRLTVKLSRDDCQTWPVSRLIYSGNSAYSAMAVLPDGAIGVLYEKDGYRSLSFVRFPLDWLVDENR